MAKVRQAKQPTVARPSAPRTLAGVVVAVVHDVRRRLGHDSGMWFLLFGVGHLVVALFLFSLVAAFQGALTPPPTFGETKPGMVHTLEAAQQSGLHPVAPVLAFAYGAATLALWAAIVLRHRRWHARQWHILGMLLVPGTFMAFYVVGHVLLVHGR